MRVFPVKVSASIIHHYALTELWMMWTTVLITLLAAHSKALNIRCGEASDIIEVMENSTSFNMTCYNYRKENTIQWSYGTLIDKLSIVGQCSSCPKVKVTNISDTSSLLVSQYTGRKSGFTYICTDIQSNNKVSCRADIIYPATVPFCSLNSTSNPWEVNGACNISKVYSSLGRYECRLFYRNSSTEHLVLVSTTPYVPGNHSDPDYRQGLCTFKSLLPSNYGSYYYIVVVYPGKTEYEFDEPVIIEPPSTPVISNCFLENAIPEGSNMTCLCSVENIGKPEGRLIWYGNGTLMHKGINGVTSLWMNQTMGFHNDGMEFACVLEWSNTSQKCLHIVNVTFKPHSMKFIIRNESTNLTVNEGEEVIFECLENDNPLSSLRVFQQNNSTPIYSEATHTKSTAYLLKRLPNVNCTDANEYTCVAENDINDSISKKVELFVNCKPRTTEMPTLPLKYKGKRTTVTFDVVAYPAPDNFRVIFLGLSLGTVANVSAYVDENGFQIQCRNLQFIYMHTCTIYVDQDSPGYYKVIIANIHGETEIVLRISIQSDYSFAVGMIGLSVLVCMALITVFVIIKLRRKGHVYEKVKKPKKSNSRPANRNVESNESSPATVQVLPTIIEDTTIESIIQTDQTDDFNRTVVLDSSHYASIEDTECGPLNLKESPQVKELSSDYSTLDLF